jgi:two-component system, chemotaxis family, chemotaxis protein CheY
METSQMQAENMCLQQQQACNNDAFTLPAKEEPAPSGQGVLIIDDSKLLQLRLAATVKSLGYNVVGLAGDGPVGIAMAVALNPRLVILDHHMPLMNGLECLRSILRQRADIKAIVCSATITERLTLEYSRLGIAGILTKPVQYDLLTRAMKEAMEEAPAEPKEPAVDS